MQLWEAVVLGIVQAVTEFFPVSSSGHLIIARSILGLNVEGGHAFDAFIHLGTLLAIVLYFWRDLIILLQTLFRKLGRLPVNDKDWIMLTAILIGTIPAVLAGFALESVIEDYFVSPLAVAAALALGSFFFMYAEWKQYRSPWQAPLSARTGFLIGLFQVAALFPGISRSGVTIAGGMLLGLSRYEAARFSFLLAIPIVAGAGLKNGLDLITAPEPLALTVLLVGALTAFICALGVIHFFLEYVRRYTLWPFIWYRLALVLLILYAVYFVWN